MRPTLLLICAALLTPRLGAAERVFDFGQFPINETPRGFRSTISGEGRPAEWKVIEDPVPAAIAPVTSKAPSIMNRTVVAQLSRDVTDEHFPLLVFEEETFGDFTLTTRFKIVSGAVEQMAGLAFRIQDEKNYYCVLASALGNNLLYFKIVNGKRSTPIGKEVKIPRGTWQDMTVDCKGNNIRFLLNGMEVIPAMKDNSFSAGKIGFWTKSDSVAYFTDTKIVYTPRQSLPEIIVGEFMRKYPRLLGLKIIGGRQSQVETKILGSNDSAEVGQPGDVAARSVIERDAIFYGKEQQTAIVTMPLHDRNGETVGAVRVLLKSFRGQTEENAVARALPIVKEIQARMASAKSLVE